MNRAADRAVPVVARLLGRHCAGLAKRPAPEAVLAYLRGPALPQAGSARTSRSLLNGCSVPEVLELIVDCGVSPARLMAHLEALDVTRKETLACLAQLTGQADHCEQSLAELDSGTGQETGLPGPGSPERPQPPGAGADSSRDLYTWLAIASDGVRHTF